MKFCPSAQNLVANILRKKINKNVSSAHVKIQILKDDQTFQTSDYKKNRIGVHSILYNDN